MPEVSRESFGVYVAERADTCIQFLLLARERMSLRVISHLQLILDVAKKYVGSREGMPFFGRDERLFAQSPKGFERIWLVNLRHFAAVTDLSGLCNQFDFTNSTGSELYV